MYFTLFWKCLGRKLTRFWSRVRVCPLDSSCLVDDWCWCLMVRVWLITSVIVQIAYPWCQGPIGLIAPLPWIRAFFSVICLWRSEFKGHNPSWKEKCGRVRKNEWSICLSFGVEAAAVLWEEDDRKSSHIYSVYSLTVYTK